MYVYIYRHVYIDINNNPAVSRRLTKNLSGGVCVYMCICLYIYKDMYRYTCIDIYIYVYTHTCTYTHVDMYMQAFTKQIPGSGRRPCYQVSGPGCSC